MIIIKTIYSHLENGDKFKITNKASDKRIFLKVDDYSKQIGNENKITYFYATKTVYLIMNKIIR